MAITLTSVNPQVYQGPVMETMSILITNGQSWKAGQLLSVSSGALIAAASNSVACKYFALKDQADPGNATTFAEVGIITKDHVFVMNELDGAVPATAVGQLYSLDVTSNVCTVDTADNTTPCFRVKGIAVTDDPMNNKSDDIHGRLYVTVLQSVLDT
jgi:hypothetical protein